MSTDLSAVARELGAHWDERARRAATDAERVDSTVRSQFLRFECFAGRHALAGASILDVGCGVGDLYGHLQASGVACEYLGVDLSAAMIERARQKYPGARFAVADPLAWEPPGSFDYTVSIGIHNVACAGAAAMLRAVTRRQFELARVASHVSVLTDRHAGFGPGVQAWRAEELLGLALELTPYVRLHHDYLPHDMAVTLYRRPAAETGAGLTRIPPAP